MDLQECLALLHSLIRSDISTVGDTIASTMSDINEICTNDVNLDKIDYYNGIIFDKDKGLIKLMKNSMGKDELTDLKSTALTIIHSLISRFDVKMKSYATQIKEIALTLFIREKYSKVKVAAGLLVYELLKITAKNAEELNIPQFITKLFEMLSQSQSKLQATTKYHLFRILGYLGELHPEYMMNYSEKLTDLFIKSLKTEITSKTRKPEFQIISGTFYGLSHLLVNFSPSDPTSLQNIFKYINLTIDPEAKISRYECVKAGLSLLGKHIYHFGPFVLKDYERVYDRFHRWIIHKNAEVKHDAAIALTEFMKFLAKELAETGKSKKENVHMLSFLIKKFKEMLRSKESSNKEISLAIRGYGLLAKPCKLFLSKAELAIMFNEVIQYGDDMYFTQENIADKVISLPTYLETLASVVCYVTDISDSCLLTLKKNVLVLIERFPHMPDKMHYSAQMSLSAVILSLTSNGVALNNFLSDIIYQGLIRTCSHALQVDEFADINQESVSNEDKIIERKISYKSYIVLWQGLINAAPLQAKNEKDRKLIPKEEEDLTATIYNELIQSVLKIISKLNLKLINQHDIDEESFDTTGTIIMDESLRAEKPKDFIILANLKKFMYSDLLVATHIHRFERWIYLFTDTLVLYCTKFPLVSSFYKLLAVTAKISAKLQYFKEIDNLKITSDSGENKMEVDSDTISTEKWSCYVLFVKFSKEVLVRMKQFKDDILCSCLEFILELPVEIISNDTHLFVPAIQNAFDIGLSYTPLAESGLIALERWTNDLDSAQWYPLLREILPSLNKYMVATSNSLTDAQETVTLHSSSNKRGKKKISITVPKKRSQIDGVQLTKQETTMENIRIKIVQFLGSIGSSINQYLVDGIQESNLQAWDTEKHLKFSLPFIDIKPDIYLDPFLPRVVYLAQHSSDRQTKVAACELLQALVVFILGKSSQQSRENKQSMINLYKKIFPAVLSLSCDIESVARQLFKPLLEQLIHWFSKSTVDYSEANELLNALTDGVVQSKNSSLRQISADGIREFVSWTIKQTTKKDLESKPQNIEAVLNRIFALSIHPDTFHRFGAAMIFNSIYRFLREEEHLVDIYIFKLLACFIECLTLAHSEEKALGTEEQCKIALNHIEKIIKVKSNLLNKPSAKRRRIKPHQWKEASIDIALRWLLRQCGKPYPESRHMSMQIICNLCVTLSDDIKSPRDYFKLLLKDPSKGPAYFIARFEYDALESNGIATVPNLFDAFQTFDLSSMLSWFEKFLASLDCYTWILSQRFLSTTDLFSKKQDPNPSRLFEVMSHFISDIAMLNLDSLTKCFKSNSSTIFTVKEVTVFNRLKCTVIVRIFHLIEAAISQNVKESLKILSAEVLSEDFFKLLFTCFLDAKSLGFDLADIETAKRLPDEVSSCTKRLLRNLPQNLIINMKDSVKNLTENKKSLMLSAILPDNLEDSTCDLVSLISVVQGYERLNDLKILSDCLDTKELAETLLNYVFDSVVMKDGNKLTARRLTPLSSDVLNSFLRLSISMNDEALISKLYSKEEVWNTSQSKPSDRGLYFYCQFQSIINLSLVKRPDRLKDLTSSVERHQYLCTNIFNGLLDFVVKDRDIRKSDGPTVVGGILADWELLQNWTSESGEDESKDLIISLLTKLILIDSKIATDKSNKHFKKIFETYITLLRDPKSGLTTKNKLLDLLMFFASVSSPEKRKLDEALNSLVNDYFPLKSSEFEIGTQKYIQYVSAVNKILDSLKLTGSEILLKLTISIFCREKVHACEESLQKSVVDLIKSKDKQKPLIDIPYGMLMDQSFTVEIRLSILERVCLPLLRSASSSAITEFFLSYICRLAEIVEAKLTKTEMENHLVEKLAVFKLIEILYARLSKNDVNTKDSRINLVYSKGSATNGNEMTKFFTKICNSVKSEDCRNENSYLELRRKYHCAAYNCLVSIIACTQTDVRFYNSFLFGGSFLFENMIDTTKRYEFAMEMDKLFSKKRQFISVRNEVRSYRRQSFDSSFNQSLYYPSSQYLADSSLSVEASHYDFTSSFTSRTSSGSDISFSTSMNETMDIMEDSEDTIYMEMDPINEHECMPCMTALLRHMLRNNITPAEPGKDMPTWMKNILEKINHHETHTNIKLFIAKLVVNSPKTFKPYAKNWFGPLINLIINDRVGGGGLNYFVVDLIVTILSWHEVAVPENNIVDRTMSSKLLLYLIKNCHHETRAVLRNNLEVLKTLVEVWRNSLDVPYGAVYEHLGHKSEDNRSRNVTGVQILGVLVANNLPPFKDGADPTGRIDKNRYYNALFNCLSQRSRGAYGSAAEVTGMVLKYLSANSTDKSWLESKDDELSKRLDSIKTSKIDQYITCLYKIQLNYKSIAEKESSKVLFLLPQLFGELREFGLEIVNNSLSKIENAFEELKNKELLEILNHRDEGCQYAALKIVKGLLPNLKQEEILYFIPSLISFVSSTSTKCRGLMYDIFIDLYDRYHGSDELANRDIILNTKDVLLQGLLDEDYRIAIQNFWSDERRLPTATIDRTIAMLGAMYSPKTEKQYLSYSTNLLLEMTSKSPDFNKELFDRPLSECKFSEFNVTHSWRRRHTMNSLFIDNSLMDSTQAGGEGYIRATQDGEFSQTIDVATAKKRPFNWLTQSTVDTFAESGTLSTLSTPTQSESNLLFSNVKKIKSPKKKLDAAKATTSEQGEDTDEILRLRRRFLKDSESKQLYFVKKQIRQRNMRKEIEKERKERRENQVTIYRKYRTGDLPDIQIKYACIIAPLQAVAQRDSQLARILFTQLFSALMHEMMESEDRMREIRANILNGIEKMISSSDYYYPPLFGAILDIIRSNLRLIDIDTSKIGEACIGGGQGPLGILLLEDILIQKDFVKPRPPTAKKAKISKASSDKAIVWIELAKLYKSLDDFDNLQSIFEYRIKGEGKTSEALALEAKGDYLSAVDIYTESWKYPPEEVEKDLWDEARLECYNNLCDWEKINDITTATIDEAGHSGLENVWLDTYYQDHYLPLMLKSKLKLIQNGKIQQDLFDFIDKSMQHDDKKKLLEAKYSERLALMYIYQEKYDRAKYYTTNAFEQFLNEWSGIGTIMKTPRLEKLRSVQKLQEMGEFLDLITNRDSLRSSKVHALNDKWMNRKLNHLSDPQSIWDDIITNRMMYIDQLSEICSKIDDDKVTVETLIRDQLSFRLHQIDSAKSQNNFGLAENLLKDTNFKMRMAKTALELKTDWIEARINVLRQKLLLNDKISDTIKIEKLSTSFDELDNYLSQKSTEIERDQYSRLMILKAETLQDISNFITEENFDETSKTLFKLCEISDSESFNTSQVRRLLEKQSCSFFKESIKTCNVIKNYTIESRSQLLLAIFCAKILRENDDSNADDKEWISDCAANCIKSLCRAMKLGNRKAIHRFAGLLQIMERFPQHSDVFIESTADIPCWMYLSWLGQMTALLDKNISKIVHQPLLKVAATYPNALVYPFNLSSEGFKFDDTLDGRRAICVQKEISSILGRNPYISTFVKSLEQFEQPNVLFAEKIEAIQKESKLKRLEKVQKIYDNLQRELLCETEEDDDSLYSRDQSSSEMPITVKLGAYRRRFAKKFKNKIEKAFGSRGQLISSMSIKAVNDNIQALQSEIKSAMDEDLRPPKTLTEYSDWLANFQGMKISHSIEIPGQYTGDFKPMPERHIKISSFDNNVQVMKSIRKPKVITVRGTDAKEHKLLVKSGEDLRLDQRVIQIFRLMNEIMREDCQCSQRDLQLRTYNVIPLTTRVGLIEWMENTIPVKDFLVSALGKDDKRLDKLRIEYKKWLIDFSSKSQLKDAHLYYLNVGYRKRQDVITNFKKLQSLVPDNLSRGAYQEMAASSEAYFILKRNFTKSNAQMCAYIYLLGIGDRHLSNTMIDKTNGAVVGIDFGYAFGVATQILPIPELIPFRLTRQFLNLMQPHKAVGLFRSTMIHIFNSLRRNADLLLAALDVFIKEPSVDLKHFEEKLEKSAFGPTGKDSIATMDKTSITANWLPKRKIELVKRKLQGSNPAYLTKIDLESGKLKGLTCEVPSKKSGRLEVSPLNDYLQILMGSEANIRAQLPEDNLTVEQQVDALIDQATDKHILGLTWLGWEPWV
ncbi:DgyrCDS1798 [Dimorphilus gyrociliatus]|uniref:DNA-dependent protein kinase catalytic subunit n=1 Tax=Dimorphilus gyrociliatus TaxID=2664684 RepID=A0A7I8VBJ7_9ANNE|nr:DgyrCDS1798 [Dimorphilus gyrociliatus]